MVRTASLNEGRLKKRFTSCYAFIVVFIRNFMLRLRRLAGMQGVFRRRRLLLFCRVVCPTREVHVRMRQISGSW